MPTKKNVKLYKYNLYFTSEYFINLNLILYNTNFQGIMI